MPTMVSTLSEETKNSAVCFFSDILWRLFITCRLTKTTPYNANLCFAPQYRTTQTINDMILFRSF